MFGVARKRSRVRGVTAARSASTSTAPLDEGNGDRNRVALLRVANEARKRRPGDHGLVAGLEHRLADVADQRVGPGGDDNLLRGHAVPLGERRDELAEPRAG